MQTTLGVFHSLPLPFIMSKIIIRPKYPLTCLFYILSTEAETLRMIKVNARNVFIIILVILAIRLMAFLSSTFLGLRTTTRHFKRYERIIEDVHEVTFPYTLNSLLSLRINTVSAFARGGRRIRTEKKGDLLDVYIVMFMLMMPF